MKQDDAPAGLFQSRQDQIAFGRRGGVVPVRRPDIRAENREAFFLQVRKQRRRVRETRKTKKRGARAAGGGRRRRDAAIDVGARRGVRHPAQRLRRMTEGMMANAVPLACSPLHQRRHRRRIVADDEERRPRAFGGEGVEDFGRRRRRSVVEGQNNFMIGKIERPWIGLETDRRWLAPADCQRSRDAEGVRRASRSCDRRNRRGDAGPGGERHKNETKTG